MSCYGPILDVSCLQCGGSFNTRRRSGRELARFCSNACRSRYPSTRERVAATLRSRPKVPLDVRFWRRVEKGDGCWRWGGTIHEATGYGVIGRGATEEGLAYAHRLSWEFENGEIPDGLYVLHKCDNRWCVRPSHLFLGSHLDNIADSYAKGRHMMQVNPERVRAGLRAYHAARRSA